MGLRGRRIAMGLHASGASAPSRGCLECPLLAERLGKRGAERRRNAGVSSGSGSGARVREAVGVCCRMRRAVGVRRVVAAEAGRGFVECAVWLFWDGVDEWRCELFFEGVARGGESAS